MYKLMIVEDEPLARAAIMKIIDFSTFGFEVVAVCEDGQEAWEKYLALLPDLVITDICMPFVSGLELAGKIAEQGRGTRVIILTGYDDFNYARQAITHQVSDYVLKPITSKEFSQVLQNAATALTEQKQLQEQIQIARRELQLVTPLARDQLLNRLIQGTVEPTSIQGELETFGLPLSQSLYQISLVSINNLKDTLTQLNVNTELLQFMLANIISELAASEKGFITFTLSDGRLAILASAPIAADLYSKHQDLAESVFQTLKQTLGVKVTIALGDTTDELSTLETSYKSAVKCLSYKDLLPQSTIITPQTLQKKNLHFAFDSFAEELLLLIRLQDQEKLQNLVKRTTSTLRLSGMPKSTLLSECQQVLHKIRRILLPEAGIEEQDWIVDWPPEEKEIDFYPLLEQWLGNFSNQATKVLKSSRHGTSQRLGAMATEYIKENYSNSHLSLMEVCQHLSVSMSYFSLFFKESTGKTFIEYVTELRMEKAKELLSSTDLMLYTVAERVGYENPAYFTVAFKKNAGVSPKEYRKTYGRKASR